MAATVAVVLAAAAAAVVEVVADGDGTGEASDKEDELPDPGASVVCGRGVVALLLGPLDEAIEVSSFLTSWLMDMERLDAFNLST